MNLTAELKILAASVIASIVIDTDMVIRFLIPILSAATWSLIKLSWSMYKDWRSKRKLK